LRYRERVLRDAVVASTPLQRTHAVPQVVPAPPVMSQNVGAIHSTPYISPQAPLATLPSGDAMRPYPTYASAAHRQQQASLPVSCPRRKRRARDSRVLDQAAVPGPVPLHQQTPLTNLAPLAGSYDPVIDLVSGRPRPVPRRSSSWAALNRRADPYFDPDRFDPQHAMWDRATRAMGGVGRPFGR
jgi:hypothetical protein